jgi:hypothetical protein
VVDVILAPPAIQRLITDAEVACDDPIDPTQETAGYLLGCSGGSSGAKLVSKCEHPYVWPVEVADPRSIVCRCPASSEIKGVRNAGPCTDGSSNASDIPREQGRGRS